MLAASALIGSSSAAPIPFTPSPASPWFVTAPGCLNKTHPVKTLIDTGAALPFGVFLTPDVAREAAVRWNLARGTIAKGSIGGPLDVYGADIIESAGVDRAASAAGAHLDGVIGPAALRLRSLAIDYPLRRIWFNPALQGTTTSVPRCS